MAHLLAIGWASIVQVMFGIHNGVRNEMAQLREESNDPEIEAADVIDSGRKYYDALNPPAALGAIVRIHEPIYLSGTLFVRARPSGVGKPWVNVETGRHVWDSEINEAGFDVLSPGMSDLEGI
jgi:hypothetical protein